MAKKPKKTVTGRVLHDPVKDKLRPIFPLDLSKIKAIDDLVRASIARSIQSIRGFGFLRRSTTTPWRKASISTFFDADDLASSASQDSTRTVKR